MPYEDSNEEKYWSAIKIGDKWSYCGRITKIETGDDPDFTQFEQIVFEIGPHFRGSFEVGG